MQAPQYERRGDALVTPTGGVLYRPRVLPQDRWLVSAPDGIHHRVYKRAGWLYRLLHGTRWRCVSGDAEFLDMYAAWSWVEQHCVNRVFADWHGVGYARWMQAQHAPPRGDRFAYDHWLTSYTTEPWWVAAFYQDGPLDWGREEQV